MADLIYISHDQARQHPLRYTLLLLIMIVCADFFPFGILNGDSKGPTGVDLSTMAAPLPVPITFYNTPRRNLFVSKFSWYT